MTATSLLSPAQLHEAVSRLMPDPLWQAHDAIVQFKVSIDYEPVNGQWMCCIDGGHMYVGKDFYRVLYECIVEEHGA